MDTKSKSIKGTKTEANLVNSYLAESQSYARYTFYAGIADKELYFPVGVLFRETALNELRHAKVFMKFLENTDYKTSTNVDAGYLGNTVANLELSMKEESQGGYEFYRAAAQTARDEGFDDIASHFEAIADVEEFHYGRFQRMLDHINNGTLWKRDKPVTWKCLVCGYTYVGTEPPTKCPGCDHPYQHYIAMDDEYVPVSD
ncbi:MAG: rubrerythrin family protein [Clostridiales bacterium]|nr:rubrerythrin family protein [Clostridiales bacterium]